MLGSALLQLNLSHNAIQAVPPDSLRSLALLQGLDLGHNLVAALPDVLEMMPDLRELQVRQP